jgi:hypothetical protein
VLELNATRVMYGELGQIEEKWGGQFSGSTRTFAWNY